MLVPHQFSSKEGIQYNQKHGDFFDAEALCLN